MVAPENRTSGAEWAIDPCVLQTPRAGENLFYYCRQRLREEKAPLRFALLEAKPQAMDLVLTSGDQLRIPIDAATLRLVPSVAGVISPHDSHTRQRTHLLVHLSLRHAAQFRWLAFDSDRRNATGMHSAAIYEISR